MSRRKRARHDDPEATGPEPPVDEPNAWNTPYNCGLTQHRKSGKIPAYKSEFEEESVGSL